MTLEEATSHQRMYRKALGYCITALAWREAARDVGTRILRKATYSRNASDAQVRLFALNLI